MSEEQTAPSVEELLAGPSAPPTTPQSDPTRLTLKVTNVWLRDGRGPFTGQFVMRPPGWDHKRQIGMRCASLTGGLVWASLPPETQSAIYAMALVSTLSDFSPEWFRRTPSDQLPPDLCEDLLARFQEWRAESFRDSTAEGSEASRRPVVERLRPVGGEDGPTA